MEKYKEKQSVIKVFSLVCEDKICRENYFLIDKVDKEYVLILDYLDYLIIKKTKNELLLYGDRGERKDYIKVDLINKKITLKKIEKSGYEENYIMSQGVSSMYRKGILDNVDW